MSQDTPDLPAIRDASATLIRSIWERWGLPIVSLERSYLPEQVEGFALFDASGTPLGLITWFAETTEAEIVTLDAFVQGQGYGSRLLVAAERQLVAKGVNRIRLVTTNDNFQALQFYARHRYRLVRVHQDAMNRVRAVKPDVPQFGKDNIELRDMWELEKKLAMA